MNKYSITLLGGESRDALRVPALVLQETLAALLEGARLATRFAVEGESTRKGPRPAWLDAACAIEITGLTAGSAIIALEAPTLREADPQQFDDAATEPMLFGESEPALGKRTAVDLLGRVLDSALSDDPDRLLADRPLLDACVKLAKISSHSYQGVRIEGLRGGGARRVKLSPSDLPKLEQLRDATPSPQAVRVSGVLDTISASEAHIVLKLADGSKVPGRLERADQKTVHALFGQQVVVSGMAHYRPSGNLHLIDIEWLGKAAPSDALFEVAPIAQQRLTVASQVAQDDASGVSSFFGTWPGDETDEELQHALRELQ